MSETTAAGRGVRWEWHPGLVTGFGHSAADQDGATSRARSIKYQARSLRARIGDSDPLTPEEALREIEAVVGDAILSMDGPERFDRAHRILRDLLSANAP